MEKLDINALTSANKGVDKGKSIKIDFKKISNHSYLNYEETNLDNKMITKIYGNDVDGFKKIEYIDGNHIGTRKEFFSNGNLRLQENIYIEVPAGKDYKEIYVKFSMGISYEYDDNGNLIKEINHEEQFKFSLDDVAKYIENYNHNFLKDKGKDFVFEFPSVNRHVGNGISIWELSYTDYDNMNKKITRRIQLDGNTGEKVGEKVKRIFTGDINGLIDQQIKVDKDSTKK